MSTTMEKLQKIIDTKKALQTSINNKGGAITDDTPFNEYPLAVDGLASGVSVNRVSNLQLSESGVLTFDEPDMTEYEEYNPIISYIITVNGTTLESNVNSVNIFGYLVDGNNSVSVVAKVVMQTNSDVEEENIIFSLPEYTPLEFLNLSLYKINGVQGYSVDGYTGTADEVILPLKNNDDLPIHFCNSLSVSKIKGDGIKQTGGFTSNSALTEIDFPNTIAQTSMELIFYNCANLRSVIYNTDAVSNMNGAFGYCPNLTTIKLSNVGNVTGINTTFDGCTSLKSITMYNVKVKFNISASTQFERSDLVTILNNLATITSTQTLTMGSTNLAKLTDEDKLIATNKGWTLA